MLTACWNQLLKCQLSVLGIGIVFDLRLVVGMFHHMLGDVDELDALFFWRGLPPCEVPVIEGADNLFQRVSSPGPMCGPRTFGFCGSNSVSSESRPIFASSRDRSSPYVEVNAVQQLIQLVLI